MRSPREEIFEVAAALVAEGVKPTVAAVHQRLGKSSVSTVVKYMQEFRGQQQPAQQPAENAAPAAVMDKLQAAGNEVWRLALALAGESLAGERAELEATKADFIEQLADVTEYAETTLADRDRIAGELARTAELLEAEKLAHDGTHAALNGLTEDHVRLNLKYDAAIDRQQELKEEAGELVDRLKKSDKELSELKARHALNADRHEKAEAGRQAAEQRANAAEVQAAQLAGELAALRAQLAQQAELLARIAPPASGSEKQTKRKGDTQ